MVYIDKLNIELWEDSALAQLERFLGGRAEYIPRKAGVTCKSPDVVAKGISAYLSYETWSAELRYKSLRWQIRNGEPLTHERIFARYFDVCISHAINENNKKDFWDKLNEKDLIQEHLEKEGDYLQYSQSLFTKYRKFEESDIMRLYKHASYYPEWVKTTKLKSLRNNKEDRSNTTNKDNEEQGNTIVNECNLHSGIFKENGFSIFHEFVKDGKSWQYDCSYAYRVMQNHGYLIHEFVTPSLFVKWVNENYNEDSDKYLLRLKTLDEVKTVNREKLFNRIKKDNIKLSE